MVLTEVPEGLGFVHPHLDELRETSGRVRSEMDPIPPFEHTLAKVLDERTHDRLEAFFDGEHDGVFGTGAGERARAEFRDALERSTVGEAAPGSSVGEVVPVDSFYEENPVRRSSEEASFGDRWSVPGEPGTWAVFWVAATGELAAMHCLPRSIPGHHLASLGTPIYPRQPASVEVLRVDPSLASVQLRIGDWESDQDEADSYGLLRQRLGLQT